MVGAIIATVAAVAIKEIPLRTTNAEPVPTGATVPGERLLRPTERQPPSPSRIDRPPDLRSSSRSTAPVDPTGAVVRPRQVAFEAMDPRPAPYPAALRALGTTADAFEAVLDVADLPPGAMPRVSRGDLDVLLAHTPDGIVATDDRCPHMSAPLSIGELDGCIVACPLHEGRFDLSTGATGPDADDRRARPRRRLLPDLDARRPRTRRPIRPARRPRRDG